MSDFSFDAERPAPAAPRLAVAPVTARRTVSQRRSGEPADAEDTEVHLIDYVKVLYKRRWTGLTAFLIVVGSASVYTFTATPLFEAKTRLLIESENPNVVSFKAVVDEDQTKLDYYQTQYNILQSRALARRTIGELKLWEVPPFGGGREQGFSVKRLVFGAPMLAFHALMDAVGRSNSNPARIPDAEETAAQSRAIDALLSHLTVAPIRNSRLVDLKYELPDPGLAAQVVPFRHFV